MRVCIDGESHKGVAIDVTGVAGEKLVRAIRGQDASPRVDCPTPGPVHDHVAILPPESFDRRDALAAAARALGHKSATRDELENARAELAALSPPSVDMRAVRRRVAEAGSEEERLRERVAELRGRLRARRETGADATAVETKLDEATRRLSEAETERIAAEQALERAERAARKARDRRERRLKLEDRVANREREVRCDLAAAVWDRFRSAVRAVPGNATVGATPGEFDGDRLTAALAVARLAPIDAPVVVNGLNRVPGAGAAATLLDAPVIYTR
jgi:chromosome segregation ATPase